MANFSSSIDKTSSAPQEPLISGTGIQNVKPRPPLTQQDVAPLAALADKVVEATGPNANTRLARILPSLVRHLHGFALEVNLTAHDWEAGLDFLNECGHWSDGKRNETSLVCSILGMETLVDSITAKLAEKAADWGESGPSGGVSPTPTSVTGPFYRPNAPLVPQGGTVVRDPALAASEHTALIRGHVRAAGTGKSLKQVSEHTGAGAALDDDAQPDMNLRGRVVADAEDGRFEFYAIRPPAYPVPVDGPAGRLLELLDRHSLRPAHIHFLVSAPGYRTLVTQLFDARDAHLDDDSVFAVSGGLVATFQPLEGDPKARWLLEYDFYLVPEAN